MTREEEMYEAVTRAANALTNYLCILIADRVAPGASPEPAKPARAKTKKESAEISAPKAEEPAAPATTVMTEADLRASALATTKDYVMRFQKSTPDGMDRARAILKDQYNVPAVSKLAVADIPKFVAQLVSEMEAAK